MGIGSGSDCAHAERFGYTFRFSICMVYRDHLPGTIDGKIGGAVTKPNME